MLNGAAIVIIGLLNTTEYYLIFYTIVVLKHNDIGVHVKSCSIDLPPQQLCVLTFYSCGIFCFTEKNLSMLVVKDNLVYA